MSIKYEPVLGVSPAIPAGLSVPSLYYVGLIPSGVPLFQWTLGYDGISAFGQLDSAWQPTGTNWEVRIAIFADPSISQTAIGGQGTGSENSIVMDFL